MNKAQKTFRITGNTLVVLGSSGKEMYLIDSINSSGVNIETQTLDGVDIIDFIAWDRVR